MSLLSRYLDDAYYSWLSSAVGCCGAVEEKHSRIEKPMTVLHTTQPHLIPSPVAVPQLQKTRSRSTTNSSRMTFRRKKSSSTSASGRPFISAPMDFMHVDQGMSHQPRHASSGRRFRPLELSIYVDNHLSPILPHFGSDDSEVDVAEPERAHTRSDSAMSHFTIPRKPLSRTSTALLLERTSTDLVQPLRPRPSRDTISMELQKPAQARLRAYTAPAFQLERVVSKIQEKDELDRKLRDIGCILEERRSVYNMSLSRPASPTAYSKPLSIYQSEEPLPAQVSTQLDQFTSTIPSPHSTSARPLTAPARPTVHIPTRLKSFTEAASTFRSTTTSSNPFSPESLRTSHSLSPASPNQLPTPQTITPPLPLVLSTSTQTSTATPSHRPKKSFSLVSAWLARDQKTLSRNRTISLSSITNSPKPITAREGFYSVQIPGRNADVSMSVRYGHQVSSSFAASASSPSQARRGSSSSAVSSVVSGLGAGARSSVCSVSFSSDTAIEGDDGTVTTTVGTPSVRGPYSPDVLCRTKTFGENGSGMWGYEAESGVRSSMVGVAC